MSLIVLTIFLASLLTPMALGAQSTEVFGGNVAKVTIDYSHGMLKNFEVDGKVVFSEVIPQYFESPFGKDSTGITYYFGSKDFSFQFTDTNPCTVQVSAGVGMKILKIILPQKAEVEGGCHGCHGIRHVTLRFSDVNIYIFGLTTTFNVYDQGGRTIVEINNGQSIAKTLVIHVAIMNQGKFPKLGFDNVSFKVSGPYVEEVKVNGREIISQIYLGGNVSSTQAGFQEFLIGSNGTMIVSDPKGPMWGIVLVAKESSQIYVKFACSLSKALLAFQDKSILYNSSERIVVFLMGNVTNSSGRFEITGPGKMVIVPMIALRIPKIITRVHENSLVKSGPFSAQIGSKGIKALDFMGRTIMENVIMGGYKGGMRIEENAVVMWSHGVLRMSPDVVNLIGKDIGMKVYGKLVLKRGNTLIISSGGKVIIFCVGRWNYSGGELYGSGVITVRKVIKEIPFGRSPLRFNVTNSGIYNITYLDFFFGNVTFNGGEYLGSYGIFITVMKWENATAYYHWCGPMAFLGIKASGNITLSVNPQMEIKPITKSLAVVIYNNRSYAVVYGNLRVSGKEVTSSGTMKILISPGIIERLMGMYHRVIEGIKVSGNEIHGKYVQARYSSGALYNYTVRGVEIANVIDFSSVWSPNPKVMDKFSALVVKTQEAIIGIHDDPAGPFLIHYFGQNLTRIKVEIPSSASVYKVGEHEIGYSVDGQKVLILVSRGSEKLQGNLITISLEPEGTMLMIAPPFEHVGAFLSLRNTSNGPSVSKFVVRPGINVSAEYEPGKILIKVSGEGNGTILDVGLSPASFPVTMIGKVKVLMDGNPLPQVSPETLMRTMQGYSVYFDGKEIHLLIGIPHFSSHEIAIEVPGTGSQGSSPSPAPTSLPEQSPTPTTTPASTTTPESTPQGSSQNSSAVATPAPTPQIPKKGENAKLIAGVVIGIIAAGVIALILSRRQT